MLSRSDLETSICRLDESLETRREQLQVIQQERANHRVIHQKEMLQWRRQLQEAQEQRTKLLNTLMQYQTSKTPSVYREVVTSVFSENGATPPPTFCITKQANLLCAMHGMMCLDQTFLLLQQETKATVQNHDRALREYQQESATTSQTFLNEMISHEQEIGAWREDRKRAAAKVERLRQMTEAGNDVCEFDEISLDDLTKDKDNAASAGFHKRPFGRMLRKRLNNSSSSKTLSTSSEHTAHTDIIDDSEASSEIETVAF